MDDPWRMYLVARRGAFGDVATGGELAGAAAVACVRRFAADPAHAAAIAAWWAHPGKVMLRARTSQFRRLLEEEPHAPDAADVVAVPPRRRSDRGALLTALQAMATVLEPAPAIDVPPPPDPGRLTYLINPTLAMSSGKTLAQIGHAATMAAATGRVEGWVADGCPARVLVPTRALFAALRAAGTPLVEVVDGGLTEVAPGTVTILALAPGP